MQPQLSGLCDAAAAAGVTISLSFLTQQHQHQQRGQVDQAVMKQSSGGAAVCPCVEPSGQMRQVDVQWEGVNGKHPRHDIVLRHREAQRAQQE